MLRKWGGRCVSAARNPGACRALRRSPYSLLQYQDASGAVAPIGSRELHVGVLGLGAIGTIFFTRLGRLAGDSKAETELPVLKVDAFVKPEQLSSWVEKEKLQLSLQGQQGDEILEFEGNSDEVTGIQAPNVRVRTLENAATNCEENKLDVLLVAVKAYDSAGVVRDLREKNKHLLKDDALCVLLQNGLGEVPRDERSSLSDADDQWQFANGVTFVGGRVLEFGSVLTSGLDTGMTYLAPCTNVGVGANEGDSKVEMLAQVLLAAGRNVDARLCGTMFANGMLCVFEGIHCEVLDESKMQAMLWRKLIVNAAINPLASLLDAPNRVSGRC
ncbi:unnamed protein product [Phytophthora lilii]|uniref:Unnamed protein product n=1 Tax=Phytophthora lilii TaxID=2077276 RepID=A0A9W6WZ98_9STRA|nr:unnamed protein product [Phytophthora lilii]